MHLNRRGWYQCDIAEALDVSEEAVSRWLARARDGGPDALRRATGAGSIAPTHTGPTRVDPGIPLARAGGVRLPRSGLDLHRIAKVIEWEFGARYHKDHVGRLLKALHWTPQEPIKRAIQRDDAAIQRWRDAAWPQLLRRARRERRVLVFEDESGFYLLPGVVKTYAPEGLTPVLREKQTRDHLSVIGGMTPEGRVYTLIREESLNGLHCIEFLLHLLRVAGQRLLVIWDGTPIHRRVEVKDFVASTRGRVWLEALPGYAPDLNPWDEGGWHHLKNVEMRNLVCRDLDELHQELDLAIGRLRRKPHLFRSFFARAGLKLPET